VLIEDHPVVLRGIQAVLAEHDDFEVLDQVSTAVEGLASAGRLDPDVVIVPLRLGGTLSGIELCRSLRAVCHARVVVFTSFIREVEVEVAILAGADALVSKHAANDLLVKTLREVCQAERSGIILGGLERPAALGRLVPATPLTHREEEILGLIVEGLSNLLIANRLTVEVSTVKTHVRSILRKLGVVNRRALLQEEG